MSRTKYLLAIGGLLACLALGASFAGAAAAPSLKLPAGFTRDMALRTYQEQLDSQSTIRGLVEGRVYRLQVEKREVKGSSARLRVTAYFDDGVRINGWLRARKVKDAWMFRDITADGHVIDYYTPTKNPDVGILNTILAEQVQNQTTIKGLVTGKYTRVEIGEPKRGFKTMTLPLTLTGPKSAKASGKLVCIGKSIGGKSRWFVAKFD